VTEIGRQAEENKKEVLLSASKRLITARSKVISSREEVLHNMLPRNHLLIQRTGAELIALDIGPAHKANEYSAARLCCDGHN
jgi:hypothetical protein